MVSVVFVVAFVTCFVFLGGFVAGVVVVDGIIIAVLSGVVIENRFLVVVELAIVLSFVSAAVIVID